jgi:hypothetical protein
LAQDGLRARPLLARCSLPRVSSPWMEPASSRLPRRTGGRGESSSASKLLIAATLETGVDHHAYRPETATCQRPFRKGDLLFVDDRVRGDSAGEPRQDRGCRASAYTYARHVAERAPRGGDDLSKVENAIAKILTGSAIQIIFYSRMSKASVKSQKPRNSGVSADAGDPYGNRTRASAVKGPRPNR